MERQRYKQKVAGIVEHHIRIADAIEDFRIIG